MSSPAKKSVATKQLLRQVAARSTGRLAVDTVDGALEVYLMNGDIIGAVSGQDDQALLRRVRLADAVSPEKLASLTRLASSGQALFGPLIDMVPTEVIEPALADRFRENLVRWVAQSEEPTFEALPGVFVDNMQMGHNTVQLIESSCKLADQARSYPVDTEIVRGDGKTLDSIELAVLELTSNRPIPVGTLLPDLPAEPWTARAAVARMLDNGLLLETGVELQELMTDEVELLTTDRRIEPSDEEDDDEPTVRAVNELLDLDDDFTPQAPAPPPEPTPPPPPGEEGMVSPGEDLSNWLHTGDLDEEDMAFFEDHEDDRGGGSGGFTTEQHNLDKIDVTDHAESPDDLLEADEAPSTRFAAPVLEEDAAVQKIAVGNDVLSKVAKAFDSVEGAGRGQAVVQLLVDGSPSKYSVVFHGLSVTSEGELLVDQVLDNLSVRPASEHRHLLHSAMNDIIERSLSSASDELPDDAFDDLYESVAGYRQRLGI